MEKKTIGQFIAALRKANGMTQQEVADRLNVSNKAVSRWERDECAPDITLIPALAEMFSVTCDELLKGERILHSDNEVKKEAKVEKQMKSLIHREISKYKTMMWIAVALALIGVIILFLLSSLYIMEEIVFSVLLLFEVAAFIIQTIAVTRMRDKKAECELFENADPALLEKYNRCLGQFSFMVYYLIAAILLWTFFTLTYFLPVFTGYAFAILMLVFLYLYGKNAYIAWITEKPTTECEVTEQEKRVDNGMLQIMNRIQVGLVLLCGAVHFFAPCFDNSEAGDLYAVTFAISICLMLVSVFSAVFFVLKAKENKEGYLMLAFRNILLFPSGLAFTNVHGYGWVYAIYAVIWAVSVILLFSIIETLIKKIKK